MRKDKKKGTTMSSAIAQAYGFISDESTDVDPHLYDLARQLREDSPSVVIIEGWFDGYDEYTYVFSRGLVANTPWICLAGRNKGRAYTNIDLINYFHNLVFDRDFHVTRTKAL